MRLHSLEITAFGPFADTVTVDFDALGADGLFLLHGQTGAGKTTVLDAVAFALYGTVPGARKDGKRLLSDHAVAGSTPKVMLDATLGGRRLRLERSPEFSRAKKKGVGVTKINAKATLTWLDGQGQNLTRIDEIGVAVGQLLGMSADQFFQVVLLPQGEFAKFLRAENDERGKLLERLFDTSRFGVAEKWLLDRRSAAAAALEKSRIAISKLCGQIATAADVAEQLDLDPLEWAQSLLDGARSAKAASDTAVDTTRAAAAQASSELHKATATAELQRRAQVADEQMSAWTSGAQHRAKITMELANAVEATRVAELSVQHGKATAAVSRIDRAVSDALASLSAIDGSEDACTADDLASHVQGWSTEIGLLTGFAAENAEGDRLQKRVDADNVDVGKMAKKLRKLRLAKAELPERIIAADSALGVALKADAELPGLVERLARATDAHAAAEKLVCATAELTVATAFHVECHAVHNAAHEASLELRERRLNGMAAELAGELTDGSPCTVCGSDVHPAPRTGGQSGVSKKDEDNARAREQAASAARDEASTAVVGLTRSVDALRQRSGGVDVAQAAQVVADTRALVDSATVLSAGANSARTQLAALRSHDDTAVQSIVDCEAAMSALTERVTHSVERISDIRSKVAAAAGADGNIDARMRRLRRLISAATSYAELRSECEHATATQRDLSAALAVAATEAHFASVDAALAAVREPARISHIEDELRGAQDLFTRAHATLEEPEVAAVRGLEPVDLGGVVASDVAARALGDEALSQSSRDRQRHTQLETLTGLLWSAISVAAPKQAAYDELDALADVVSGKGQNSRKMSLRSYVLAARLEEVAESASARLRRMSSGRYEFVHSDAAGSNGKRGGLGLDIRDEYTGATRPAKTLSGGESFFASLALALGLADVVAAESGGVVLDTMFIDEGFGSLDSDTLESVMGVLDDLRAGGRVVGIVSHVDEMRQRIPNRLHVIRGNAGSSLEVFAAS